MSSPHITQPIVMYTALVVQRGNRHAVIAPDEIDALLARVAESSTGVIQVEQLVLDESDLIEVRNELRRIR